MDSAGAREKLSLSCHQCKSRKNFNALVYCTSHMHVAACKKKYCLNCLKKFYDMDVPAQDKPSWICPACNRFCKCALCKRKTKERFGPGDATAAAMPAGMGMAAPDSHPTGIPHVAGYEPFPMGTHSGHYESVNDMNGGDMQHLAQSGFFPSDSHAHHHNFDPSAQDDHGTSNGPGSHQHPGANGGLPTFGFDARHLHSTPNSPSMAVSGVAGVPGGHHGTSLPKPLHLDTAGSKAGPGHLSALDLSSPAFSSSAQAVNHMSQFGYPRSPQQQWQYDKHYGTLVPAKKKNEFGSGSHDVQSSQHDPGIDTGSQFSSFPAHQAGYGHINAASLTPNTSAHPTLTGLHRPTAVGTSANGMKRKLPISPHVLDPLQVPGANNGLGDSPLVPDPYSPNFSASQLANQSEHMRNLRELRQIGLGPQDQLVQLDSITPLQTLPPSAGSNQPTSTLVPGPIQRTASSASQSGQNTSSTHPTPNHSSTPRSALPNHLHAHAHPMGFFTSSLLAPSPNFPVNQPNYHHQATTTMLPPSTHQLQTNPASSLPSLSFSNSSFSPSRDHYNFKALLQCVSHQGPNPQSIVIASLSSLLTSLDTNAVTEALTSPPSSAIGPAASTNTDNVPNATLDDAPVVTTTATPSVPASTTLPVTTTSTTTSTTTTSTSSTGTNSSPSNTTSTLTTNVQPDAKFILEYIKAMLIHKHVNFSDHEQYLPQSTSTPQSHHQSLHPQQQQHDNTSMNDDVNPKQATNNTTSALEGESRHFGDDMSTCSLASSTSTHTSPTIISITLPNSILPDSQIRHYPNLSPHALSHMASTPSASTHALPANPNAPPTSTTASSRAPVIAANIDNSSSSRPASNTASGPTPQPFPSTSRPQSSHTLTHTLATPLSLATLTNSTATAQSHHVPTHSNNTNTSTAIIASRPSSSSSTTPAPAPAPPTTAPNTYSNFPATHTSTHNTTTFRYDTKTPRHSLVLLSIFQLLSIPHHLEAAAVLLTQHPLNLFESLQKLSDYVSVQLLGEEQHSQLSLQKKHPQNRSSFSPQMSTGANTNSSTEAVDAAPGNATMNTESQMEEKDEHGASKNNQSTTILVPASSSTPQASTSTTSTTNPATSTASTILPPAPLHLRRPSNTTSLSPHMITAVTLNPQEVLFHMKSDRKTFNFYKCFTSFFTPRTIADVIRYLYQHYQLRQFYANQTHTHPAHPTHHLPQPQTLFSSRTFHPSPILLSSYHHPPQHPSDLRIAGTPGQPTISLTLLSAQNRLSRLGTMPTDLSSPLSANLHPSANPANPGLPPHLPFGLKNTTASPVAPHAQLFNAALAASAAVPTTLGNLANATTSALPATLAMYSNPSPVLVPLNITTSSVPLTSLNAGGNININSLLHSSVASGPGAAGAQNKLLTPSAAQSASGLVGTAGAPLTAIPHLGGPLTHLTKSVSSLTTLSEVTMPPLSGLNAMTNQDEGDHDMDKETGPLSPPHILSTSTSRSTLDAPANAASTATGNLPQLGDWLQLSPQTLPAEPIPQLPPLSADALKLNQ